MSEQVLADYIEKALKENNLHCIRDEELKKYIKYINNWNELKDGLRSLYNFDEGVVSKDYLECVEDTLDKMEEIEKNGTNE